MKNSSVMWLAGLSLVLAGCASGPEVQMVEDATVLEQPRVAVLFPDYLWLDDFKLNDHGRIPSTGLIGADMTTPLDLRSVRSRYSEQLDRHGWTTDKMEIGRQYFRVLASHEGEHLEIRAVQGSGPTQVFLLYRPVESQGAK